MAQTTKIAKIAKIAKTRTYSIGFMLRAFTSVILVASILSVFAIVSVSVGRSLDWVADANKAALRVIVNDLDRTLAGVDAQFYTYTASDGIARAEEGDAALARVASWLRGISSVYPNVNGLWYFAREKGAFVTVASGVSSMDETALITARQSEKISAYASGRPAKSSKWTIEGIGGAQYLTRITEIGGTYCGAWLNLEKLARAIQPADDGAELLFCGADAAPLFGGYSGFAPVGGKAIVQKAAGGERYLSVNETSEEGDYCLAYLTKFNDVLFRRFDAGILVIALVGGLAVFLLFVAVGALQRLIYRPLVRLEAAMGEVRGGNLSPAISGSRLTEFYRLSQTFEYMLEEIKHLTVDVYEQKLEQQRIKRRFLQIQLKSHFYLNCLNIIHSLAQVKNFALIQDLTRSLGEYFRYIAEDCSMMAALGGELEHVRNYMHIQEIRFPNKLKFIEDVPESLYGAAIPPLVLQTFVENAIEHAIDLDKENFVRLSAKPEPDSAGARGILIEIRDSGKGFTDEQLARFNAPESDAGLSSKDGIGIRNVMNRLALIYAGAEHLAFSNAQGGGAAVRLWIPLRWEGGGDV